MKSRPARRGRVHVARTMLIMVAGIMVGLFLGNLIGKLSDPYRQAWRQRSELRELTGKVEAERREREQLRREIAKMQTPQGMLMEARRLGYLRRGERMLRYVRPENWPRAERPEPAPSRLSRLKEKMHRLLDKRDRRKEQEAPGTAPPD